MNEEEWKQAEALVSASKLLPLEELIDKLAEEPKRNASSFSHVEHVQMDNNDGPEKIIYFGEQNKTLNDFFEDACLQFNNFLNTTDLNCNSPPEFTSANIVSDIQMNPMVAPKSDYTYIENGIENEEPLSSRRRHVKIDVISMG